MELLDILSEGTEDTHANEGQNCEKSSTSEGKRVHLQLRQWTYVVSLRGNIRMHQKDNMERNTNNPVLMIKRICV